MSDTPQPNLAEMLNKALVDIEAAPDSATVDAICQAFGTQTHKSLQAHLATAHLPQENEVMLLNAQTAACKVVNAAADARETRERW